MRPMHHDKPERCIDCGCCSEEEMKCYPNSRDCHEVYDLDETDLTTPDYCDFFIRKK